MVGSRRMLLWKTLKATSQLGSSVTFTGRIRTTTFTRVTFITVFACLVYMWLVMFEKNSTCRHWVLSSRVYYLNTHVVGEIINASMQIFNINIHWRTVVIANVIFNEKKKKNTIITIETQKSQWANEVPILKLCFPWNKWKNFTTSNPERTSRKLSGWIFFLRIYKLSWNRKNNIAKENNMIAFGDIIGKLGPAEEIYCPRYHIFLSKASINKALIYGLVSMTWQSR